MLVRNLINRNILTTIYLDKTICVQVTLSQAIPGCRSLLITISPHWLAVNHTSTDLYVVDTADNRLLLPAGEALVPPQLKVQLLSLV